MLINLVSDTITKPSKEMLAAMMRAEVGDDVFESDPTVNALQEQVATMFGKEAALFCPSGTMTNQIAIKLHTQPLDELICEVNSHVYQYETAGYAFNSGVAVNLIHGRFGKMNAEQIEAAIKDDYDWLPHSRLVVLENSTNKGGGNYYTIEEIRPIQTLCRNRQLKLHLDGARLFNVLVETGEKPEDVGQLFDSISICLSKGLGAPVGSLLIGDREAIKMARRYRKVMGGGMRQAGILAAAGRYALENNILRLKEDNDNARLIGQHLEKMDYVAAVMPVMTNILIFTLSRSTPGAFLDKLESYNVKATAFGPMQIRFVTHMHFGKEELERLIEVLDAIQASGF